MGFGSRQFRHGVDQLIVEGVITEEQIQQAFERKKEAAIKRMTEELAAQFDSDDDGEIASAVAQESPARTTKSRKGGNGNGGRKAKGRVAKGETAGGKKAGRRNTDLTAEQIASRQLQGKYISLIRQVPKTRRGEFKKLVEGPGGRAAAIKAISKWLENQ